MAINSGIYWFRNTIDGKIYIGQSKYLKSRYSQHKIEFRDGTHHNEYLQKAVNKYGFENFEYKVLKKCPPNELDDWEIYYIEKYDTLNRDKGYNIKPGGNNSDMADETKEKIRFANMGKNNKLTAEEVAEIKLAVVNGAVETDLAKKYGVQYSTISKIVRCKNWKQVSPELNEQLLKINENKLKSTEKLVKGLYYSGYSVNRIKKEYHVGQTVINRILSKELADKKEKENNIRSDFMSGMPRNEIIAKYGLSDSVYKRIVHPLREEKKNQKLDIILDLLSKGFLKKEIAQKLGYNRCTITEILKKYKETHANTEISGQIAKG